MDPDDLLFACIIVVTICIFIFIIIYFRNESYENLRINEVNSKKTQVKLNHNIHENNDIPTQFNRTLYNDVDSLINEYSNQQIITPYNKVSSKKEKTTKPTKPTKLTKLTKNSRVKKHTIKSDKIKKSNISEISDNESEHEIDDIQRELLDVLNEHPIHNNENNMEQNEPAIIRFGGILPNNIFGFHLDEPINVHIQNTRNHNIQKVHKEHKKRNRKDDIDIAAENLTVANHDDNAQNSHNSTINKFLRKKYKRLVELNESKRIKIEGISDEISDEIRINQTFTELEQFANTYSIEQYNKESQNIYANNEYSDIQKRQLINESNRRWRMYLDKIKLVIKEIKKSGTISSITEWIDGIPTAIKEDIIVANIWSRFHHSENEENQQKLKIALLDNMADAVKKKVDIENVVEGLANFFGLHQTEPLTEFERSHNTYCINGRVSRYLNSFTLNDADEILTEPMMDHREVANAAYMQTGIIINEGIEEYEQNSYCKDPIVAKKWKMNDLYGEDYENLNSSELLVVRDLERFLKNKIEKYIKEKYSNLVSEEELNNIIEKALLVV